MHETLLKGQEITVEGILHDLNFEIVAGDRLGIVGASGSGKSTLLTLLNRLREPDQGQLWFNERPFDQVSVFELRRQVALVLQEPKLLGMSVQESLAYPLVLQKRPKGEIQEKVLSWCDRLSIPLDWLDRQAWQLSLGQRQLVTIGRALILNPTVLLLDEPTSALDVGTAHRLLEVLASMPTLTWVMVNHQLDWVRQWCDRVWYLHEGQIWSDTTVAAINWDVVEQELKAPVEDWG